MTIFLDLFFFHHDINIIHLHINYFPYRGIYHKSYLSYQRKVSSIRNLSIEFSYFSKNIYTPVNIWKETKVILDIPEKGVDL